MQNKRKKYETILHIKSKNVIIPTIVEMYTQISVIRQINN